jgi:hypothetical protein
MLNNQPKPARKPTEPIHPLVLVGFTALVLGLLGWLWTGEWRYAVTGVTVLLATAVVVGAMRGTSTPPAN